MPQEIKIDGIGISPDVLTAIVSRAVTDVEGIASVGVKDLATNLVSMMLSSKAPASDPAVEAEVIGDKLALTVRVVVFFGYPFKKLAEAVRSAVVAAIDAQVGVEVERVDVCIDGLVFPKDESGLLTLYGNKSDSYRVSSSAIRLKTEVVRALDTMFDACFAETGCRDYQITQGYRTLEMQTEIYDSYRETYGEEQGALLAAMPGYSEHHSGLAFDMNVYTSAGVSYSLGTAGQTDPVYNWIYDNAAKYGFILRYPESKTGVTGITNEPWHFRYVGRGHAAYMTENGLTLEEYIALLYKYPENGEHLSFTYDGVAVSRQVLATEVITEPVPREVTVGTKSVIYSVGNSSGTKSGFIWPTIGGYVSCGIWGYPGHTGMDIAGCGYGSNIYAAAAGTVVTVKWSTSGYGYHIIINHGDGIQTLYAHCSNLYVTVGQYVNQGDIIAAMGSTGNSTGTHLHFEVRVNGQYVNPKNYVSK